MNSSDEAKKFAARANEEATAPTPIHHSLTFLDQDVEITVRPTLSHKNLQTCSGPKYLPRYMQEFVAITAELMGRPRVPR